MADEKKANPFEDLGSSEREISGPSAPGAPAPNAELPPYTPPQYAAPQPYSSNPPPQHYPPNGVSAQQYPPNAFPPQQYSYPQPPITNQKRPIAIPAIDSTTASPFLRAYPPLLETYNLPRESFYSFLDQLNDVMNSSPPMQVLDATGGILQAVPILFPLHWIGSAVSGLANLGGQGISKSRADSAIRNANKDIFGPRGLKAEIAKMDAVAHIANIPVLDSQGKINRQAPLVRQLNDLSYPSSDETHELDHLQQRIQVLQPWIAELNVDTLPWTSKSRLHRFNAALKKNNNSDDRGRGRDRDSRNRDSSDAEEDSGLKKSLWLVIREVGGEGWK